MRRTSRFVALFLGGLAAAWQPCAAHAAQEETQLWLMDDASLPRDARTDLALLVMPRELSGTVGHGGGVTYVVPARPLPARHIHAPRLSAG